MTTTNYCENCLIEFRVTHGGDKKYFVVLYCPFCGNEIDTADQYDDEDEEE